MLALACPTDHSCCGDTQGVSSVSVHQLHHVNSLSQPARHALTSHQMDACACQMGEVSSASPLILSHLNPLLLQPVATFDVARFMVMGVQPVAVDTAHRWLRDESDRHKRLQVFLN